MQTKLLHHSTLPTWRVCPCPSIPRPSSLMVLRKARRSFRPMPPPRMLLKACTSSAAPPALYLQPLGGPERGTAPLYGWLHKVDWPKPALVYLGW